CFSPHDPPTSEIYTLSLHDALPILCHERLRCEAHRRPGVATCAARGRCAHLARLRSTAADEQQRRLSRAGGSGRRPARGPATARSEEHTSELQSRENLVCRLLLEKK